MLWFLNPHLPLLHTMLCQHLSEMWHQDWGALPQMQLHDTEYRGLSLPKFSVCTPKLASQGDVW